LILVLIAACGFSGSCGNVAAFKIHSGFAKEAVN